MNIRAAAKNHENKFTRCIKAPFRVLCKARDFYVRALTDCSGNMNYSSTSAMGPGNMLPKSFSTNSSRASDDEDMKELIRAVAFKDKLEMELRQQLQQQSSKLPRSFTVGIVGRIDEDKVYDFEEEFVVMPRSKSHAVNKRMINYSL